MDNETTALWLATVPLLQGVFKLTGENPAARRAVRAAAILRPMTLGTPTPGCVVVDGKVTVVGGVVVVVLKMLCAALFCAAVGAPPHDVTREAVTTPAIPSAATRPPDDMAPLWFLESGGAAGGVAGPAI
jgi:hypothetical protein